MKLKELTMTIATLLFITINACNTNGKRAIESSNQYNKLTPEGEKVKIVRDFQDKNCKEIDTFSVGVNLGPKQQDIYLKNRTAKLGGNAVYLHAKNFLQNVGYAYKCP